MLINQQRITTKSATAAFTGQIYNQLVPEAIKNLIEQVVTMYKNRNMEVEVVRS